MIGAKLKQLRIKNNLKQSDVALLLNVTQGAVGMYENDKRTPSAELIVRLAELFNVTTDYLLGHTETNYSVNANIPEMPSIVNEEDTFIYNILDEKKDIESLEDMNKLLENTDCNDEVKEVLRKYIQLNEIDKKVIERIVDNAYERLKEED
ncbi:MULTISPECIES: helix-turn-helix transcriptional regulator [unclassified Clostridioides]|uniref:helix-turn-helix domain-containing protein n=1 Tax=unclassified Clostridioides TaxID=2635829 RepID=UPI001D0CB073|nr:helix-turn-helix transcriptional regulator [Clostridioides sp. ES-S-0049-03]MCC0764822.1 helix-turn-helix transcriptional regulator [Clostridioides sp. ES-S-0006-03]